MIISDGQQKRLVQAYKITNRQLRKQLQNLNNEVDRIISFKTNRIGLKKLPAVDKNIAKTNDVKLLQHQVDNLRKRLQQLNRDNEATKQKTQVNHMQRAKELQNILALKKNEREQLKKQVYYTDKHIRELNTQDAIDQEMKLYDKIQQLNQEFIRVKKIQTDLMREIQEKRKNQTKKSDYIEKSVETHQKKAKEASVVMTSRIQMPITHRQNQISQQQWKNIKKQFLQLKQSKQRQQTSLNEQNDRLRAQIRGLQNRMKQKKSTIDNIRSLQIKRKERNYSTLDHSSDPQKDESFRYRNRGNAYKYNTKN